MVPTEDIGIRCSGARGTESCETPDIESGNQTVVLRKSNSEPKPLSHYGFAKWDMCKPLYIHRYWSQYTTPGYQCLRLLNSPIYSERIEAYRIIKIRTEQNSKRYLGVAAHASNSGLRRPAWST